MLCTIISKGSAAQLLAGANVDERVEPASLTKLMTAYLVFDALRSKKIDLKQTLPVSARAWKMPGSRMFIDPKMQVPVEDLIKGMIVQSGNDATMALAEGVGNPDPASVRAAMFHGLGRPITIETIPDPKPGPNEVLIKVCRCGVCGSDISMTGDGPGSLPLDLLESRDA